MPLTSSPLNERVYGLNKHWQHWMEIPNTDEALPPVFRRVEVGAGPPEVASSEPLLPCDAYE
jgi:hypothetical protein